MLKKETNKKVKFSNVTRPFFHSLNLISNAHCPDAKNTKQNKKG